MGLAEQAGVEHDVLGADEVSLSVMGVDRADELLIGLNGKASFSRGERRAEGGMEVQPTSRVDCS